MLNGDTLFEADLEKMANLHQSRNADLTMALKRMQDFDRYGLVDVEVDNKVLAFREKQYAKEGLINAGVYLVNRSIFEVEDFPPKFSFEKAVLEAHLNNLNIVAGELDGYFIDIGIPEDFAKAQKDFLANAMGGLQIDPEKKYTLFLDRDGVINQRNVGGYITSWSDFKFLPGVLDALADFSQMFQCIVIVTNQQGIGKGIMTKATLEKVHNNMLTSIQKAGGHINKVYFCPELSIHNPKCRKPNIGMGLQAKADFPEIDFGHSIMVGDSLSDIEFGQRLGMQTVLIENKMEELEASKKTAVNKRVQSLFDLAKFLKIIPT